MEPALAEREHGAGPAGGVGAMRDDDPGAPRARPGAQGLEDQGAAHAIEIARGLVGEQEP